MNAKKVIFTSSTLSALVVSMACIGNVFAAGVEKRETDVRRVEADVKRAQEVRISELAQRIDLPVADTAAFVRSETEKTTSAENAKAVMELIGRSSTNGRRQITPADVENADMAADTLNAIIRLKKNSQGNLHIGMSDLVEINKSWSKEQKENFNSVLRRSSEISEATAKAGRSITADEAFTKALEEKGLLEKYNAGCRN